MVRPGRRVSTRISHSSEGEAPRMSKLTRLRTIPDTSGTPGQVAVDGVDDEAAERAEVLLVGGPCAADVDGGLEAVRRRCARSSCRCARDVCL